MAKIRRGFVSNSSSSSFIIAGDPNNLKLTVTLDLEELIDDEISNKEELDEAFLDRWDYYETIEELLKDSENLSESYYECLGFIKMGKKVYFGSMSSDDEGVSSYVYQNGFHGGSRNFDVIMDEG
jgi:hypothetical protein